ncbi:MAG: hypothetical protein SWE60_07135 [Thermodesulfobacteriota bacterium]|nr:hypothetical protein [Thermodesulfobacteriota bacterium]
MRKTVILKCPTCKAYSQLGDIEKEALPQGGYLIRCGKCQCMIGIKDQEGRIKMLKPREELVPSTKTS